MAKGQVMRRGWQVGFGGLEKKSGIWQENYSLAFRPWFSLANRIHYSLPIPFVRRRDAEACAALMTKHIPHPETLDADEFCRQFAAIAGGLQETVDYLVATCCQW